jgi:hypothetical protein
MNSASDFIPSLPAPAFYFPLAHGRYDVAPGLSKFGKPHGGGNHDAHVFQIDADHPRFLAAKRRSLDSRASKYFQTSDLTLEVEAAVVRFIVDRLCREHFEWFSNDDEWFHSRLTGESFKPSFDALAMQVQEDLAIVSRSADRHWLSAAHVCLPNGWGVEEKIGRPFAAIHEPVAGMAEMNRRGDQLVRMMIEAVDGLVRFAWGVTFDDQLDHHPHTPRPAGARRFDPSRPRAFLRVERQTIWGFPAADAALFTIRTYLYDVNALAPPHRTALRSALATMPPDSVRYKGLAESRDDLLAWLGASGRERQ